MLGGGESPGGWLCQAFLGGIKRGKWEDKTKKEAKRSQQDGVTGPQWGKEQVDT